MRRVLATALAGLVVPALALSPARAATPDPYLDRQWGLQNIEAEQAWTIADGTGTVIAVVDSGVDLTHPDLATKLIVHPDADFVEPEGECTRGKKGEQTCIQDGPQDEEGHGTHVAGIAGAATGNGIGVAGTAPEAELLPVRVLDENADGETRWVASGIRYAVDKGADVVNLSLGYGPEGAVSKITGRLAPVYEAIDYAWSEGVTVVVAAGNHRLPLCSEPSAHPKVLCVGATGRNDVKSFFSNSDPLSTRYLVAPGGEDGLNCAGDIFSTYLRGGGEICSPEDGYEALAGTSMAAPFVSGVAAMLAGKGLSNSAIVQCILENTDDLGPSGRDAIYGYGRLNALKAVSSC